METHSATDSQNLNQLKLKLQSVPDEEDEKDFALGDNNQDLVNDLYESPNLKTPAKKISKKKVIKSPGIRSQLPAVSEKYQKSPRSQNNRQRQITPEYVPSEESKQFTPNSNGRNKGYQKTEPSKLTMGTGLDSQTQIALIQEYQTYLMLQQQQLEQQKLQQQQIYNELNNQSSDIVKTNWSAKDSILSNRLTMSPRDSRTPSNYQQQQIQAKLMSIKYQVPDYPNTVAKRQSTIQHKASISLDNQQTLGMLQVRNLNQDFNREGHLKEIRGQLDKMKKYAQDKFGYRAQYINIRKKFVPFVPKVDDRLATSIPVKHQRLLLPQSPGDYRMSQQNQLIDYSSLDARSRKKKRTSRKDSPPNKLLQRRGKNGQLIVNAQNAQTDMGVGPDSPGISSLQFGGQPTIGYVPFKQEESQISEYEAMNPGENTQDRAMESALADRNRNQDDTEILSSNKENVKSNDVMSQTMMDKRDSMGITSPQTIQDEVTNDLRREEPINAFMDKINIMNSQQHITSGNQLTIKQGSFQMSGPHMQYNESTLNQFLTQKSLGLDPIDDKLQTIYHHLACNDTEKRHTENSVTPLPNEIQGKEYIIDLDYTPQSRQVPTMQGVTQNVTFMNTNPYNHSNNQTLTIGGDYSSHTHYNTLKKKPRNSDTMADIVERYVNNEKYKVQFQIKETTTTSEISPKQKKEKKQFTVAKLPVVKFTERIEKPEIRQVKLIKPIPYFNRTIQSFNMPGSKLDSLNNSQSRSNSKGKISKRVEQAFRMGSALSNDSKSHLSNNIQDLRRVTFPDRIHPSFQPGVIVFKDKPTTQHSPRDSEDMNYRQKMKIIQNEKAKLKNLQDQHLWKLKQQPSQLNKGLRAQLIKERQSLHLSFINDSKEKQRMRGLSYGGQQTLSTQNNQVINSGYRYTNIQGTSITTSLIGQQSQGLQKVVPQGDIKERLANGILKNTNQFPQLNQTLSLGFGQAYKTQQLENEKLKMLNTQQHFAKTFTSDKKNLSTIQNSNNTYDKFLKQIQSQQNDSKYNIQIINLAPGNPYLESLKLQLTVGDTTTQHLESPDQSRRQIFGSKEIMLSGVQSSSEQEVVPGSVNSTEQTMFQERTLQFSNKLLLSLDKGNMINIAEEDGEKMDTPNVITQTQTEIMNNYKY